MAVKITHTEGLHFKAEGSNGYGFELDKLHDGSGPGASPMELLLMGLAGCTGMDVISILEKSKQQVTGFEVIVDGDRAEDYPMVWTNIRVQYVLKGHGISEDAVKRAIELSETTYCSAAAMLRKSAPIESSYKIEEDIPVPV